MNHASIFLIVATAATLLACGKSEDLPAPATQPTAVEAPQAEPAMEPVPPVVETPQPETVTAVPPPEPPTAAKPTPTRPVNAAPAAKTAGTIAPDLAHGQTIYHQACAFCHDKGVAGAPKPGDKDAWTPRLAQGMDALYAAALRGKGAMPAKGGNPALTENDVHAAVDHLVDQSR